MRLIDPNALMDTIIHRSYTVTDYWNNRDGGMFLHDIERAVNDQPTVDAVPVKHGKWIQVGHIEHMQIVYKCSACNGQTIVDGNFCPNCGARMDGERKEECSR